MAIPAPSRLAARRPAGARGYILYMALILLMAVTVMAVIAMRSTVSEEIMARGHRDLGRAMQAAETQIQQAETSLDPTAPLTDVTCSTIDAQSWADARTQAGFELQRIDPCDGSSSLAMGGSATQKTDLKYRILATDYDNAQRRGSQVAIESIFIP